MQTINILRTQGNLKFECKLWKKYLHTILFAFLHVIKISSFFLDSFFSRISLSKKEQEKQIENLNITWLWLLLYFWLQLLQSKWLIKNISSIKVISKTFIYLLICILNIESSFLVNYCCMMYSQKNELQIISWIYHI